ncbi:MAG: hypothetical protein JXA90_09545 [Planctomycetes bacterium]|nr:hypothetical protein [Planctomycetota bacterium]
MSRIFERTACWTVLACAAAALLSTGCSSDSSVKERRRMALGTDEFSSEDAWAEEGFAPLTGDSGWEDIDRPSEPRSAAAEKTETASAPAEETAAPSRRPARPRKDEVAAADASGGPASRVIEDMRLEEQQIRAEAAFEATRGRDAYARQDYETAEKALRRSLDLVPGDEDVRRLWNQTLMLLNRRQGEVATIADSYLELEKVRRDQIKEEINQNISRARALFESGELKLAEYHAKTAVDMAQLHADLVVAEQQKEARELLEAIEKTKNEIAEADRRALVAEADRRARLELEEEGRRKEREVQDLLHKASRHIRRYEYRKAIEACESVVSIDPDNKVAAFWLRQSNEQLKKKRLQDVLIQRGLNEKMQNEAFLDAATPHEDVVFPLRDEWDRIRKRAEGIQTLDLQEPEPIRKIRTQLETQVIQNVNFEDTSLKEVIDTFKEIAGVNILIDPDIDREGIKITQPINNLTAMRALRGILEANNLTYVFRENIMMITSKDDVQIERLFDVYNVTDLLTKIKDFQAPEIRLRGASETTGEASIIFTEGTMEEDETMDADRLMELIRQTTGGEIAWGESTITENRGQLFIDAPRELHAKVKEVLSSLRQDADLFVVIEARFIDINDDFLEDVGIDSRALGIVNNLGEPFGNIINDNSTGGNDLGLVQQGDLDDVNLVSGLDRWAGRVQHIIDGFSGMIRGDRVSGGGGIGGATIQATWLEPFQVNVILRMVQEKSDVRQLTAPIVTAHNNERVYVSIITQRAYIADYELVSGGTGYSIIEVADPVVQTFQEGVILDVDPTISHDKKYVTLDVRPTLATLIGGIISTINISLGSFTNVAFQVPIGIPQISLQQSFTSVTVPNGGTVLLGGFKSLQEGRYTSYLPILGQIPIVKNLARRRATIREKRSLVILLNARIVDLRGTESRMYNVE